ncbi:MAG: cell wall hydrolase [Firmicutes bacterium]|nr:cell wall hydrolase [Bacillota bacterium]
MQIGFAGKGGLRNTKASESPCRRAVGIYAIACYIHVGNGVINDHKDGTYQFTPVMNGRINRPASVESIRAAKDALNGWDPTKGAVYFFATYVKNQWLWSKPLSRTIGNHVFTY